MKLKYLALFLLIRSLIFIDSIFSGNQMTIRQIFSILWGCWVLVSSQKVSAQSNISFQNLTIENGLASHQVRAIVKDQKGFIWVGTADGLQRYDGYEFRTFHLYENDNLQGNNVIRTLFIDKKGILWIGTQGGGLKRFQNGKFDSFQHDPKNSFSIPSNDIEVITEDLDGNIWIGTKDAGLSCFRDEKFTNFQYNPKDSTSLSHNAIFSLLIDRKGMLWVGTYGGGLNRKNADNTFTHFRHDAANPKTISGNYITALSEDRTGTLWIGTWQHGLNKFKSGQFQHINPENSNLNNASVMSILEDRNGIIWIGTWGGGINRFENGQFTAFEHRSYDSRSPCGNYIETIFEDQQGILWIGTFAGGISRIHQSPFTIFETTDKQNSLTNEHISGIHKTEDGTLWIGSLGGGLHRYKDRQITHFQHPDNSWINAIRCISSDTKGNLWLGTEGGLVKFKNGTFQKTSITEDMTIYAFHTDSKKNIYFGGQNGIIYKIENEQTSPIFIPNSSSKNEKLFHPVFAIFKDSKDRIWVGRHENSGLQLIDNQESKIFTFNPKNSKSIPTNNLWAIFEDAKQQVWIGSVAGLSRYDENGGFDTYTRKDGLPHGAVQGIESDKRGNLWVSTTNGLLRFRPQTQQVMHLTTKDGLPGDVFTRGSVFKDTNGELYFGTNHGLVLFHPDSLKVSENKSSIFLVDFQVFNKSVIHQNRFDKPIEEVEKIEIETAENVFTFGFSSLDFANPNRTYQYYLEGFEKDFNPPSQRRFVTYTNIPSGKYTFRVRSSQNVKELAVRLQVHPPFIETTTFKVLLLFLICGVPVIYYYYHIYDIKQNNQKLEKLVKEQTAEAHKEREIAQTKAQELQEANEELTSLAEELRQNSEELSVINRQFTRTERKLQGMLRKEKQQLKVLRTTHESLKSTQGQLVQSEKMASLGVLTAGIAHEINNPVNFIFAGTEALQTHIEELLEVLEKYTELDNISPQEFSNKIQEINDLKEEIELEEDFSEDTLSLLADVRTGAIRITEIVKGLRTFSRLDEDASKLVSLEESIDSTLVILRNKYKNRIEIIKNYGANIPKVECYPGKLNQVFMNLLANAIQAIEAEGKIYITTQLYEEHHIRISIRDTGAGIPEEVKNRIFEPFFTTKEVGEGTGLGLSISHGIIEKHEGKISVESEEGKGTEFSIILPLKLIKN